MKRIISIICLLFIFINLVGCAKCISTDYENVEVAIVDKYHRAMWLQPVRAGKTTTYITHPATWYITVEYDGVKYTVHGSETYNKYKDKIGQTATGTLEIKTYDNGNITYDIIELE